MLEQLEFVLPSIVYCPCGHGVWEGISTVRKLDAAWTMRVWHARCFQVDCEEQARKRARRDEREKSAIVRAFERMADGPKVDTGKGT
jgi:hypothetical protein